MSNKIHQLPYLIQEKLDWYGWRYRQKQIVVEYHKKFRVKKGYISICESLREWGILCITLYWDDAFLRVDPIRIGYISDPHRWTYVQYIMKNSYPIHRLSKYHNYSSGMTNPNGFKMMA